MSAEEVDNRAGQWRGRTSIACEWGWFHWLGHGIRGDIDGHRGRVPKCVRIDFGKNDGSRGEFAEDSFHSNYACSAGQRSEIGPNVSWSSFGQR